MWSILYLLRNNPEKLRWSQKRRGLDESIIDKALKYDIAWRKSLKQLNDLRHKHNLISREIPKLKGVEREEKIKEAKRIEKEISTLEEEEKRLEMEREKLLRSIPNVVHEDVPIGESDLDNVPIRFYGKHRVWKGHLDAFLKQTEGFKVDYEVIDWKPVGHADALEMLGLGDTLRAAKVAGSRFYYLFEDLVWLDLALLLYALDHMAKLGFKPCIPPYMLRRTPYEGVITLGDFEDAIYKIEGEDLYLIATSEHPM
ncbi:MAG: serine--tRNA ligase, partial [Thermoplasmata archaeon]